MDKIDERIRGIKNKVVDKKQSIMIDELKKMGLIPPPKYTLAIGMKNQKEEKNSKVTNVTKECLQANCIY